MKINGEWLLIGGMWIFTAVFYWWIVRKEDRKFHEVVFKKPEPHHHIEVFADEELYLVMCTCGWGYSCEDFDGAMELALNHPERRS